MVLVKLVSSYSFALVKQGLYVKVIKTPLSCHFVVKSFPVSLYVLLGTV